jgi:hypothetical protein
MALTPQQRSSIRRRMSMIAYAASFASGKVAELVVNGSFAADTTWNKGTGWTIGSGVASRGAQAGASSISQAMTLIPGCTYQVTFTITAFAAGSVRPRFTGGTAVDGTARASTGTFVENLIATANNNTFAISANTAATDVSIDNVSVIRIHG